ncbi:MULTISPECIES: sulfite exporter TauE/SafE family protein [unclassified Leptolyngbya]|nr:MULTISPECIES: sulfite exporter TauE/SafE family protein [unclassified Leptolyngbya]MBD1909872.1 sulfite exporter TauE/SafE family protein [Leptolyngbya sp. FACHB-8]
MPDGVLVVGIIFLAAIAQSITGFGFALIAVSLLTTVLGLQTTVPLVSVMSLFSNGILWYFYRHEFDRPMVLRLSLAGMVAMPLGVLALRHVPQHLAIQVLGVVIVAYVLYDFCNLALPPLKAQAWVYGIGFLAGLLTGAYNVGGPPVVLYGNCQKWTPQMFRSNLPAFFLINSAMAIVVHLLQGNYTAEVWRYALYSTPLFILGLGMGAAIARQLNPALFRKVVLVLLFLTGLNLLR